MMQRSGILSLFVFFPVVLAQDLTCNHAKDIIFVIEGSNIISHADYGRLKHFVSSLIGNIEIGEDLVHVGMIVYSREIGDTVGLIPFKQKDALKKLASNLKQAGFGTDTALGTEWAQEIFREEGRNKTTKITVIITYGKSSFPNKTIAQADLAKEEGIIMMAIGVGEEVDGSELEEIVSGQPYLQTVDDFLSLDTIITSTGNLLCQYLTSNSPMDIIIVIDGSDSISYAHYSRLKQHFVSSLIGNLEIGPNLVNVGLIVYSTEIGDTFGLFPFKQKIVLKKKARNLKQGGFGSDTALGIERAGEMFHEEGRNQIPNNHTRMAQVKCVYAPSSFMLSDLSNNNGGGP